MSTLSPAVTLGVTGIVVSGVVGPAIAAYFSRRGDQQRFARDRLQRDREDLRALVDQGAVLLGAGGTNLRLAHEAASRAESEPDEVREWAGTVHLLGQRLLLRLPADHRVVVAYESVRSALVEVGETHGNDEQYPPALEQFEIRRAVFLDQARATLERLEQE